MSDTNAPAFYRDQWTPPQRRRAESLIMLRTLWPSIQPEVAQTVAEWITTGHAKVVPPTPLPVQMRPRRGAEA